MMWWLTSNSSSVLSEPCGKGIRRPLATHMQGAVLALPNHGIAPTPVAFVIGLLNFVSIQRLVGALGVLRPVCTPLDSRHAILPPGG
ncbi:hypothetical protein OPV22_035207 [Ensete ventricosum]|uniref:SLC26A/SulP transporter domain-containing protein n=1 Tax=Ensete ventricosum TaxID=4639 RepID=A0AAX5KDR2_ENSVE|nr:hypothetical protein OPV22_035207 [Ensete ventricosum]